MSTAKKGSSPSDASQAARSAANKVRKLKGHMANLRKAHEARGTARATRREAARVAMTSLKTAQEALVHLYSLRGTCTSVQLKGRASSSDQG